MFKSGVPAETVIFLKATVFKILSFEMTRHSKLKISDVLTNPAILGVLLRSDATTINDCFS